MLCSYFSIWGSLLFCVRGTGGLLGAIDCVIIIGGCLGMGRDALGTGGMHVLILVFKWRAEGRRERDR